MMALEDFAPTSTENEMMRAAGVLGCEQVAIGWLRAARKANRGRRYDDPSNGGLGDIFGGLFKR